MRVLLSILLAVLFIAACSGSSDNAPVAVSPTSAAVASSTAVPGQAVTDAGPGGYGFDRSDPEAGIANIMEAFATDEATATCVFEAWGDVANVPPEQLTPELMTFEICGTSILRMITGNG